MQEVIGSNPIFSTKPLKTRFKAGFSVSDSEIDSILELSEKKHPHVLEIILFIIFLLTYGLS
jgi:hypothetical protein